MAIIRTDQWLEEEFASPINICKKLIPYFKKETANTIYGQLSEFGMYRPTWHSSSNFDQMVKQHAWDRVEQIFQVYKSKWNGPDVPVFLFPLAPAGGFLRKEGRSKGGVSFPDKMFLFLSDSEDPKEIEALFVHEYHHVCRLRALNQKMENYTLLDSIVIEGLAEYAVLRNCGRNYVADWCSFYTDEEIAGFWKRFLNNQLDTKKSERSHDALLYGGGRIPKLLGYAAGFSIVSKYYQSHNYSVKTSFSLPAANYLEAIN